jgi:GT2 family glycosyltransferase
MKIKPITVVIPTLCNLDQLKAAIKSIVKNEKAPSILEKIIIVDNSGNLTLSQLPKSKKIIIQIIKNENNLGFAMAANEGVRESESDFSLILNDDIILDEEFLKKMLKAIKANKKIKVFFPLVLNASGKAIESLGLEYELRGKAKNIKNGQPLSKNLPKENREIWGAPASALVINTKTYKKIGGFDPDFFAYIEDVDLSLRLQEKKNKTFLVPQAICYHTGGETSKKIPYLRSYMGFRNWLFIIIKHYPLKTIIIYLPQIMIERLKNFYDLISSLQLKELPNFFKTILKDLRLYKSMLAKRQPLSILNK